MNQNPIVRSESVSIEYWHTLTREGQIHWWLEESRKDWNLKHGDFARKKIRKALRLVERGILSKPGAGQEISECFTDETLSEAWHDFPSEVKDVLIRDAASGPLVEDEQAWSEVEVLHLGIIWRDDITSEDIERYDWSVRAEMRSLKRVVQRLTDNSEF